MVKQNTILIVQILSFEKEIPLQESQAGDISQTPCPMGRRGSRRGGLAGTAGVPLLSSEPRKCGRTVGVHELGPAFRGSCYEQVTYFAPSRSRAQTRTSL